MEAFYVDDLLKFSLGWRIANITRDYMKESFHTFMHYIMKKFFLYYEAEKHLSVHQ